MQTHELKRKTKNRADKIVGRGGKRGKTSGRGGKGQTARSGSKLRPELRDLIKKLPKLRGYSFNSIETKPFPVNLSTIEEAFQSGDVVSPATLAVKGIVGNKGGVIPKIKILGDGEISKKLTVKECAVSGSAKEKIEKAGGKIN